MKRPGLFSLTIVVCLQFSLGYTEDVAAKTDSETSKETSLSRAKRGNYEMLRLGRGLHMLRLGKRNGESDVQDDEDLEDTYAWPQAYDEHYPYNLYIDDTINPEYDVEIPAHGRFRRSTPTASDAVPSEVLHQQHSVPKETTTSDLKIETEEEPFDNFEDENIYLDDGIIQPEEGGDDEDKRSLGMLRLGKRQLSMLRLGKRSLGMLRLGKREPEDDEEKRSLGMLRLGKRQLSMLRLGKRSLGMLRLGKRQDEDLDETYSEDEKRSLTALRLGRRPMSMLRLGKRPMSMLRLGKRPMGMLRLGKRPMGMLRLGKRPMSMLRLGKRPMSMLRLGKREEEDKRSLGMLRLGKRSPQ